MHQLKAVMYIFGAIAVSFLAFIVYMGPLFPKPIEPFTGARLWMLIGLTVVAVAGHMHGVYKACGGPPSTVTKSKSPKAEPCLHDWTAASCCWKCGVEDPNHTERGGASK